MFIFAAFYIMRFILYSSITASALAHIDANQACQSVCGRIAGVNARDECKRVVVEGHHCKNLYEDRVSHEVVYEVGTAPSSQVQLTIGRAIELVSARDDNCYAMCYGIPECMQAGGSYCEANGVCGKLFWNKFSNATSGLEYQYLNAEVSSSISTVNEASSVLCDPSSPEGKKVPEEDHKGYVDMCKALCTLSHTQEQCDLVQRSGDVCYRLFWANDSKEATEFSVRKASGTQTKITVQDAFDRLLAENNSCDALCKAHPQCKFSESHCRKDNRTCHNLFYYPGSVNRKDFRICHGDACNGRATTPITCRLATDPVELFKKAASTVQPSASGKADVTTSTRDAGIVSSAIAMLVTFAVIVL